MQFQDFKISIQKYISEKHADISFDTKMSI